MLPAKATSGIPVIDETWGGLYRGGAYLLYGRAQSGNRLLALQLAQAAVEAGETCLFVSPSPPEVLADRAAHLGLDLGANTEDAPLRLLHVPPVAEDLTDDALAQALVDLTALIRAYAPSRLVIDDFTPFTRFESWERFASAFFTLLDRLTDATLVLAMHAPATASAEQLVAFVKTQMTGVIELQDDDEAAAGTCTLVLRPGRFHAEGVRIQGWSFGPPPQSVGVTPAPRPAPGLPQASRQPEPLVPTFWPETQGTPVLASAAGDDSGAEDPPGIHFFESEGERVPGPEASDPRAAWSAEPPDEPPSPPERESARPPAPLPDPTIDPFEYALGGAPSGSTQSASSLPLNLPLFSSLSTLLSEPVGLDFGTSVPRREFIRAFDAARVLHEAAAHPFLTLALHMSTDSPAAERFPLVVRGLRVALGEAYVLLADETRLRLVALLPGGTAEEATEVFRRLKAFLEDASPDADRTVEETSALLLPNGRPFHTAEAFLAYTFDS